MEPSDICCCYILYHPENRGKFWYREFHTISAAGFLHGQASLAFSWVLPQEVVSQRLEAGRRETRQHGSSLLSLCGHHPRSDSSPLASVPAAHSLPGCSAHQDPGTYPPLRLLRSRRKLPPIPWFPKYLLFVPSAGLHLCTASLHQILFRLFFSAKSFAGKSFGGCWLFLAGSSPDAPGGLSLCSSSPSHSLRGQKKMNKAQNIQTLNPIVAKNEVVSHIKRGGSRGHPRCIRAI